MKILICGYGNIGYHTFKEFEKLKDSIVIYDKYKQEYNQDYKLNFDYDIAFVCVPTEMKEDGSCNTDEVRDIIGKLQSKENIKTIVLKCTVPVGTCDSFNCDKLVYSPEFYGTTQHCDNSPNFVEMAGDEEHTNRVCQLYQKVKNAYFKFVIKPKSKYKLLELTKYMENCWIGTKVTFCNEFARVAKHFNVNYNELRECWLMDTRISPSHTFVYEDQPYFNSHCINKDVPGLIKQCEDIVPLMSSVLEITNNIKENREYYE